MQEVGQEEGGDPGIKGFRPHWATLKAGRTDAAHAELEGGSRLLMGSRWKAGFGPARLRD